MKDHRTSSAWLRTMGITVLLIALCLSFVPTNLFALVGNGAIQGLVTCKGAPVAGTVISVSGPAPSTQIIWTGSTDTAGGYNTDFILSPGDYSVQLYYLEGVCQFSEVIKPATVTTGSAARVDFAGTECADLIQNGSFESMDVWQVGSTPWPAGYSTAYVHSGARSMRSGIEPANPDRVTESSFYQQVVIPADAANATLTFWYRPFTQEPTTIRKDWRDVRWTGYDPRRAIAGEPMVDPQAKDGRDPAGYWYAYDWQEVLVLDQHYRPLEVLMRELSDDGEDGWLFKSFDLTPYRGQTITIYFNTINNGLGNMRTWMYVDDVQVYACAQPPACVVTPTNQWVNLYGLDSTYFGAPLPSGKIVKAYDPDDVLAGCFVVRTNGRYGAMPVYADDPDTPADEGCEPGDAIRLTVDGEPAIILGPDAPVWTSHGDLRRVEFAIDGVITRTLRLNFGWNLISFDVMPLDTAVENVLAPIAGHFSRVLGFTCEDGGLSYYPSLPPAMNTLTDMDPYHGYWIYMTDPRTLTISGPEMPDGVPIGLCERWNLAGYLPDGPLAVEDALESIEGDFEAVLGFDQGALSYYVDLPPEMNSLQVLEPGFGYWVRMTREGTLVYPPASPAMYSMSLNTPTKGPDNGLQPTPRWADAYSLDALQDNAPLPVGAVVEAFDPDGVKIGHFVVREAGRFGPMPLYGDDPATPEDEGASPGDRITFMVNGQKALTSPARPIWIGELGLMRVDLRVTSDQPR